MSIYTEIISKQTRSPFAIVPRAGLRVLSEGYRSVLAIRNWYYDALANVKWLDRPCISVGNITVGGTGKTPLVIWLAGELIRSGSKVAIISRGYKGGESGNDELKLVSTTCPQAICIAHPDRVSAGRYAIQEHGVDVILLDDGFQHRRMGRDLDIVLIDASCPLGHGYLLPRGLLREPFNQLLRADVIVITRISQMAPQGLADLKDRCAKLAPEAKVIACDHRPTQLVDLAGHPMEISQLAGRSPLAFSGIGNPKAFSHTLTQIGAKPRHTMTFRDHHHYRRSDCQAICDAAQRADADTFITTEKDIVKLREVDFDWPMPLWALQIMIDFAGNGDKMLLDRVNALVNEEPSSHDSDALPAD